MQKVSSSKSVISFVNKNVFTRLRNFAVAEPELFIIGLLSFAFYLSGICWGLPYATNSFGTHSWEIDAVTGMQTLSELHNLFVRPKDDWYLAYPPFHYFIVSIFYAPYLGFLYLTGEFSQPATEYPFGLKDPVTVIRNLTLIGRAITVLMASGIVINAYLTALTIWDKRTAILTAIAVALPTTIVFYARTGNLEVPMLFWFSLTVLMMARALTFGLTVSRAAWIGIFAAFSVATKDQACGALSVGLILLILYHLKRGTFFEKTVSHWKSPLVLILFGAVFFVLASGLPISPQRFFGHIEFIKNFDQTFYSLVHLDLMRPNTPLGYAILMVDIAKELFAALGPVLLFVGIFGLITSWRSSVFVKILFAMLLGYILLVIVPIRFMQFRYMILPAFIIAFFIARAFALGLRQNRKWLVALTFAVMIAGFGWLGLRAIDLTYQMIFDARYQAANWFVENGKTGDKVAFFTVQNVLPPFEKGMISVQIFADVQPIRTLQENRIRFVVVQPDWSSEIGAEHSHFFPKPVYSKIKDGSLGYRKAAVFETAPLFRGFFLDLPLITPGYIVNPPVTIYELTPDTPTQN